ncbi:hypothetical protein ACPXB3_21595, partial [Gordonia sp. DT219]|uniref:hypothetical protein n=1 Tax=Gordonia sp. DT219 TaxID=3416658 RepID=UPI003CF3C190
MATILRTTAPRTAAIDQHPAATDAVSAGQITSGSTGGVHLAYDIRVTDCARYVRKCATILLLLLHYRPLDKGAAPGTDHLSDLLTFLWVVYSHGNSGQAPPRVSSA